MHDVYRGMVVTDTQGRVGVVREIESTPAGGERVIVQRDDGETETLLPTMYTVSNDTLRISTAGNRSDAVAGATNTGLVTSPMPGSEFDPNRTQALPVMDGDQQARARDLAGNEEVTIPVIREEAVVRTRPIERGGVRVHKTVNEHEEVVEQPTLNEEVDVERVPIGRVIDIAPGVREEGDTLIIPVLEEMLVVEKRLVLKEEIRITKRRSTENEQARVVLREEQVQIEPIGEQERGY